MLDVPPVYQPHALDLSFFLCAALTRQKAAVEASWRAPVYDLSTVSQSVGAGWRGLRPRLCFVPAVVWRSPEREAGRGQNCPRWLSESFNQGWSQASFFPQPELLVWETNSSPVPMRNRSGRRQRRRRNSNLFFCLPLITWQLVYLENCDNREFFRGVHNFSGKLSREPNH